MIKPRNRGIVRLDEEILHRALNLGENQRVRDGALTPDRRIA